jgi:hypothetical protein
MDLPPQDTPIVCDMSTAPDTAEQRLAEYHRLFATALISRERTRDSVRFRLRAEPGVEAWVRDLAAREKACCPFFGFDITTTDSGEVVWEATVIDDDTARAVLDEFSVLVEAPQASVGDLRRRFTDRGLEFAPDQPGPVTAAQP